jgi:hypothetical protein
MKKILLTLALLLSLAVPAATMARTPYAAPSPTFQVSDFELQHKSNIELVMKWNEITYDEALARIRHGLDAQSGVVGFSKEIPRPGTISTYNPRYNAFQNGMDTFYAGLNAVGAHVFLLTQRHQVMEGSYRYCPVGQTYTYLGEASECK